MYYNIFLSWLIFELIWLSNILFKKMKKKGILLAGGLGTRLKPITIAANKHFLPIYNKPLFFYPLSILIMGGVKEIQIVSDSKSIPYFKKIISNLRLKTKFFYQKQDRPLGIVDGIKKSKKFLKDSDFILILGDNFFYGQYLSKQINDLFKKKNAILLFKKKDTKGFGVAKINKQKLVKVYEKPKKFISNDVVTGLYVFENKVVNICHKMKPSKRGELEVTDLNNILINKGILEYYNLGRGSVWLDAGTFDDLLKTSEFVKIIQDRSGFEIADLREIEKNFYEV